MGTAVKFIPVTSDELLELYQLAETIWFPSYRHSHSEEKLKFLFDKMYNQKEMLQQLKSNAKQFFFIENDSHLKIGYFALEPANKILKLDKIYVDQSQQKLGIGGKVIDFLKEHATQNNFKSIVLNVNRKNESAIGFYKKHHFIITDSIDIDAGNGFIFDDYVMRYDL